MTFSKEDLDHLLTLSRLSIPDAEKDTYHNQIQSILNFMTELDQLPLDNVEPSAYAHQTEHPLRDDDVNQGQNLLLETNAPIWEDGCFSVPKMS